MPTPVKMPRLGESVAEGTIGSWLKNEGDYVERDESLAEIVTDKINAELPSHIRLRKVVDRSTFIRDSVDDVQTTLLLGGLLTYALVDMLFAGEDAQPPPLERADAVVEIMVRALTP